MLLPRHHSGHSRRVSEDREDHVLPLDVYVLLFNHSGNHFSLMFEDGLAGVVKRDEDVVNEKHVIT